MSIERVKQHLRKKSGVHYTQISTNPRQEIEKAVSQWALEWIDLSVRHYINRFYSHFEVWIKAMEGNCATDQERDIGAVILNYDEQTAV